MAELTEIAKDIESELDEKDTIREIALKSARAITRLSSSAISAIHKDSDISEYLSEARDEVQRLKSVLAEHPDLYHSGYVENALQEYVEFCILKNITDGEGFLHPQELGVTSQTYLLGLGDVVGELRRFALEFLKRGEIEKAAQYLEKMEEIYSVLMRFHYPSALVAVKRKQDVARSIIEKTRGEIAVGIRGKHLEEKLEELEKKL